MNYRCEVVEVNKLVQRFCEGCCWLLLSQETSRLRQPSVHLKGNWKKILNNLESKSFKFFLTIQERNITGPILFIHVGCQNVVRRRTNLHGPQELQHGWEDENSLIFGVGDDYASVVVAANARRAAEFV